MAKLDLIDWPADRTLSLSGSAGALRIPVTLRNTTAGAIQVSDVSLAEVRLGAGGKSLRVDPIPVQVQVAANGTARARIRLRLDPATPPGRYQGEVKLAGISRPIEIEVVERTELVVRPSPLVVDAALGPEQRFAVAFENRGNTALTIDLTGDYPLGEEMPLAPDRIERPSDGVERLGQLFKDVMGLGAAPVLTEIGSVGLFMPGGPVRLEPGAARTEQIAVVLPEGLSPVARHHAFAPVYATDLHIVIVTAAKRSPPAKARRRKQGTAE
jgi:hypothetical protein